MIAAAIAAAQDPRGEGSKVFIRLYAEEARAQARACDDDRRDGRQGGVLRGIPLSIKDVFDVRGDVTRAGSIVLDGAPVASEDAPVVQRLRNAGAVLVGRTNMTEFAYSGLGINPHYGTPLNPYERQAGRIPGGSSSGAAVAVSDGMAAVSVCSDTGGSVRIPAALCGLTGFKPTARRIPVRGMLPLSPSLDSVGVIAPTVACCALVDSVLAGISFRPLAALEPGGLRLGLLRGHVLDGLDAHVSRQFDRALVNLNRAGMTIGAVAFPELAEIPAINAGGGFPAVESYQWHRDMIATSAPLYDPSVLSRIMRGQSISDATHEEMMRARARLASAASVAFGDFDAWILPTVPEVAPLLASLADSGAYNRANAAMLRNTAVFNFLDGCALTLPCHRPGEAPVGLMIGATAGMDQHLLRVGAAIERVLLESGAAVAA